jgi:hypothetical protein
MQRFASTLPASKQMFTLMTCTFTLGIVTLVTLTVLALVGAAVLLAYVLHLAFTVVYELSASIATLYAGSDSAIRLLIIVLICWGIYKLAVPFVRSVKASWR